MRWWFLIFAGSAVLLMISFYFDAGVQAWMARDAGERIASTS